MPACVRPRDMWALGGQRGFVEPAAPALWTHYVLRCRKCAPCLLSKAGEWAARYELEGYFHDSGISVCLTYADEFLPPGGSLRREDQRRFLNTLRKRSYRRGDIAPRPSLDFVGPMPRLYIMAAFLGEYSPPPQRRPHYHGVLYDYFPADSVKCSLSRSGAQEWSSAELSDIWGFGRVTFQLITPGTAGYLGGHQAGKLTADERVPAGCEPEYHAPASRRGIGRSYAEAHGAQALENGFVVANSRQIAVPSYLVRRAAVDHPELAEAHADARLAIARAASEATPPERFPAIEACAVERIKRQNRGDNTRGGGS